MEDSDQTMSGVSDYYLTMESGLSIGYQEELARVQQEEGIQLGQGTHYLLARNGRGKTTLLRTLAGVLESLKGTYSLKGRCQLLSEDLSFDVELSAQNIFKSLLVKNRYKEAMALADKLELDVKKPYGKLSTGNKRKVALLVAEYSTVEGQIEILLLDEPFTGLDAFAREIFQDLWAEQSEGIVRLVSCHPDFDSMEMASSVVISDGDIVHLSGGDVPKKWGDLKTKLN